MRFRRWTNPIMPRVAPLALGLMLSMGVAGTSGVARAQVAEVEVLAAPPVARVEVIPARPSPRHFWQYGYWGWNGVAHYWVPGRYEVIRSGWGWAEPHWVAVGPRYRFYPGRWYPVR